MLPLTKKELKLHQDAKMCYFVKEDLHKTLLKIKTVIKLDTIAIKMVNIEAQDIVYAICPMKFL